MKVALFIPCLNEHFFAETSINMVKVLRHLNIEVEYVEDQTCCGQPAFNSGYVNEVKPLAEKYIKLFADHDYIIAPSGSCVSMVKNHYGGLDLPQNVKKTYERLKSKIYEFSEFLVDVLNLEKIDAQFQHKITFHDSCHALRELFIKDQPRKLINMIKGIQLIEMNESDSCCGFGGTFSYKYADVSIAMVARKCENIVSSEAEFCVGVDSSCLMNIDGYLKKNNPNIKTLHIADLLAKSMNL